MNDIRRDISQTFAEASETLSNIVVTMRAFDAFLQRVRDPSRFWAVPEFCESPCWHSPLYCETPSELVERVRYLKKMSEDLEVSYLYDPASKDDILLAMPNRKQLPAMLGIEATTHVEAVISIAERLTSEQGLGWLCTLIGISDFEQLDDKPDFAAECELRAVRLRGFLPVSAALEYLRVALAVEEEACRNFFDPRSDNHKKTSRPQATAVVTLGDHPQIVIDGSAIALKYETAVYLKSLIDCGDWMSGPKFNQKHPELGGNVRVDRLEIPAVVRKRVDSQTGKGSRWLT